MHKRRVTPIQDGKDGRTFLQDDFPFRAIEDRLALPLVDSSVPSARSSICLYRAGDVEALNLAVSGHNDFV